MGYLHIIWIVEWVVIPLLKKFDNRSLETTYTLQVLVMSLIQICPLPLPPKKSELRCNWRFMFGHFLCPLLISLIYHFNLWVTIFPLLMKNTWAVSWVRSPKDRAWASDLASRDFYRQWFQEEGSKGSRIGPGKKLSKDLVSAEDCLSLTPQGALGHQMHHRASLCLVWGYSSVPACQSVMGCQMSGRRDKVPAEVDLVPPRMILWSRGSCKPSAANPDKGPGKGKWAEQ